MSDQSAHFVTGEFIKPELVVTHFHLREGDTIADFGAGRGYFTKILAGVVGEEGHVYALEIQKNLVETIGAMAKAEGLDQIDTLWCDMETAGGTKLSDDALDAAVLVNALFQLEDKAAAVAEIKRTLRPGGKLFVIDWTDTHGGLGPASEHVVTESAATALFEEHGFTKERTFPSGEHHYGLAFRV